MVSSLLAVHVLVQDILFINSNYRPAIIACSFSIILFFLLGIKPLHARTTITNTKSSPELILTNTYAKLLTTSKNNVHVNARSHPSKLQPAHVHDNINASTSSSSGDELNCFINDCQVEYYHSNERNAGSSAGKRAGKNLLRNVVGKQAGTNLVVKSFGTNAVSKNATDVKSEYNKASKNFITDTTSKQHDFKPSQSIESRFLQRSQKLDKSTQDGEKRFIVTVTQKQEQNSIQGDKRTTNVVQKCRFPFIADGITYFACVNSNDKKNKRKWCSTTSNFDRDMKWMFCGVEDLAKTEMDHKSETIQFAKLKSKKIIPKINNVKLGGEGMNNSGDDGILRMFPRVKRIDDGVLKMFEANTDDGDKRIKVQRNGNMTSLASKVFIFTKSNETEAAKSVETSSPPSTIEDTTTTSKFAKSINDGNSVKTTDGELVKSSSATQTDDMKKGNIGNGPTSGAGVANKDEDDMSELVPESDEDHYADVNEGEGSTPKTKIESSSQGGSGLGNGEFAHSFKQDNMTILKAIGERIADLNIDQDTQEFVDKSKGEFAHSNETNLSAFITSSDSAEKSKETKESKESLDEKSKDSADVKSKDSTDEKPKSTEDKDKPIEEKSKESTEQNFKESEENSKESEDKPKNSEENLKDSVDKSKDSENKSNDSSAGEKSKESKEKLKEYGEKANYVDENSKDSSSGEHGSADGAETKRHHPKSTKPSKSAFFVTSLAKKITKDQNEGLDTLTEFLEHIDDKSLMEFENTDTAPNNEDGKKALVNYVSNLLVKNRTKNLKKHGITDDDQEKESVDKKGDEILPGAKNINIFIINHRSNKLDMNEVQDIISQTSKSKDAAESDGHAKSHAPPDASKNETAADQKNIADMVNSFLSANIKSDTKFTVQEKNSTKTKPFTAKDEPSKTNAEPNTASNDPGIAKAEPSITTKQPAPINTNYKIHKNESLFDLSFLNEGVNSNSAEASWENETKQVEFITPKKKQNKTVEHQPPISRNTGVGRFHQNNEQIDIPTYGGNGDHKKCVFPFLFEGSSYFDCISSSSMKRDKPWCSVTGNYDKMPIWGYCDKEHPYIRTTHKHKKPEPIEGVKGAKYYAIDERSRKMQLGDEDYGTADGTKTIGGNANGKLCVFPFVYDGETYTDCIPRDDKTSWCAVTHSYDSHPIWGNCCNGMHCHTEHFVTVKE